jgi:hypothetical protein
MVFSGAPAAQMLRLGRVLGSGFFVWRWVRVLAMLRNKTPVAPEPMVSRNDTVARANVSDQATVENRLAMAAGQPLDQTGTQGAEERVVPMHQSAEERVGPRQADVPGPAEHVYQLAQEGPQARDPESGHAMGDAPAEDAQAADDPQALADNFAEGDHAGGEMPGESPEIHQEPPSSDWYDRASEPTPEPMEETPERQSGEYGSGSWSHEMEPAADDAAASGFIEPIHRSPPPVDIAAARSEFAAAELRASAVLSEGFIESEAVRVRGKQEARMIIQRAEERASQVLERTNAEAQATERRARLSAEAMLAEAQVRLDAFLQDHVGEEEEEAIPEPAAPTAWASEAWPAISREPSEPPAPFVAEEPSPQYEAERVPYEWTRTMEAPFPAAEDPFPAEEEFARETPAVAEPIAVPPPPASAPVSQSTSQELPVPLFLAPLPPDGEKACYRISGALTFAQVMALERTLAGIEGVRSPSVTPEAGEGARISFISDDPAGVLGRLISASGLPIQIAG